MEAKRWRPLARKNMRLTTILFFTLTISSCGQGGLADKLENKRLEIEKKISADKNKIFVLAKVRGQESLQIVKNEDWPDDIEITYNILKNSGGQIIYVGEFPTSESGDWNLGLKHYFEESGQLIAFEKRLSYFNDNCSEGSVIETSIELYDNNFKIIKETKSLTDNHGKPLDSNKCNNGVNWKTDKRATVEELVKLKKIRV